MTDQLDTKIRSLVAERVNAAPMPPPLPELPSGEGSPRHRRRMLVVVFVCAALAVGVVYLARNHSTPRPDVSSGPSASHPGLIIVDDGQQETALVDPTTGARRTLRLPHRVPGDYSYALLATEGHLAYMGEGGAWTISTRPGARPHRLGPASFLVPSATPGRVWLVTSTDSGLNTSVREAALASNYRSPTYTLPPSTGVVAGTPGGLLLDTGNGVAQWQPGSEHLGRSVEGPSRANLVDLHGRRIAWGSDCSPFSVCPTIHVTNLATGHDTAYPAPAGTAGWVTTAGQGSRDAFSPDGTLLAVRAAAGPPVTNPDTSTAYIINLSDGSLEQIPSSTARYLYSRLAWLPQSAKAISIRDDNTIQLYNATHPNIRTVPNSTNAVALITTRR